MGSDLTVVNAARVSFDKESEWMPDILSGVKVSDELHLKQKDIGLIHYLAKNNHWTPFSHVMLTMRETVPIFVARQRLKHFIGFNTNGASDDHEGIGMSYNEVSRRYVSDEPEFFFPDVWRGKPINAKQGSSDEIVTMLHYKDAYGEGLDEDIPITEEYKWFIGEATEFYNRLIANGVAPEQARMVLPQSMFTSYYVTGSLPSWARALKLRIDGHAQKEIQDLATQWDEVINAIPELKVSWKALTE